MPELPTVCDTDTPKARKLHRCCECDGEIRPGENYHRCSGLWGGQWIVFKTCIECELLREKIAETIKRDEDYPAFGELYEDIFESRYSTPEWLTTYMDTRRKRNSPESVRRWMEEAESAMAND